MLMNEYAIAWVTLEVPCACADTGRQSQLPCIISCKTAAAYHSPAEIVGRAQRMQAWRPP